MNSERKLRLLPPPEGLREPGGSPRSEDEAREALALVDALERDADPLAAALRAAARPEELDAAEHEMLLARALGEVDEALSPPTRAERGAAERLRAELELEAGVLRPRAAPREPCTELAVALRSAYAPEPISQLRNEALIARALGPSRRAEPRRVAPRAFAALAALAAVAAAVLFVWQPRSDVPAPSATAMAPRALDAKAEGRARPRLLRVRSSASLFDATAPFPRRGGESERIDRIAQARAADLRANRYASWGVR